MKKPKVFITRQLPKEAEEHIAKYCDYEIWNEEVRANYDDVLEKSSDIDGLLLALISIDENLLNHAPNLKVVSNFSVGYNNFDIDAMKKHGVIGTNTAGSLDNTVADFIVGLLIATGRRIPEFDRYVKAGKWRKEVSIPYGKDITGSSVGIIGMGRIGEKVARRLRLGFDLDVNYYNRSRKPKIEEELGVNYLEFDSLLKESDYVIIMTPLTDETYHLMGEREFGLMKEDAIFINASRGEVVDEKALIKALEKDQILRAGLDVFENEPVDKDNPLLKMDNVIALPHMAPTTKQTRDNMMTIAAKNLVQALTGEEPDNLIPEFK